MINLRFFVQLRKCININVILSLDTYTVHECRVPSGLPKKCGILKNSLNPIYMLPNIKLYFKLN